MIMPMMPDDKLSARVLGGNVDPDPEEDGDGKKVVDAEIIHALMAASRS
jgi:hypothetical protein